MFIHVLRLFNQSALEVGFQVFFFSIFPGHHLEVGPFGPPGWNYLPVGDAAGLLPETRLISLGMSCGISEFEQVRRAEEI